MGSGWQPYRNSFQTTTSLPNRRLLLQSRGYRIPALRNLSVESKSLKATIPRLNNPMLTTPHRCGAGDECIRTRETFCVVIRLRREASRFHGCCSAWHNQYVLLNCLQINEVLLVDEADARLQFYLADVRFDILYFRKLFFEVDFAQ